MQCCPLAAAVSSGRGVARRRQGGRAGRRGTSPRGRVGSTRRPSSASGVRGTWRSLHVRSRRSRPATQTHKRSSDNTLERRIRDKKIPTSRAGSNGIKIEVSRHHTVSVSNCQSIEVSTDDWTVNF